MNRRTFVGLVSALFAGIRKASASGSRKCIVVPNTSGQPIVPYYKDSVSWGGSLVALSAFWEKHHLREHGLTFHFRAYSRDEEVVIQKENDGVACCILCSQDTLLLRHDNQLYARLIKNPKGFCERINRDVEARNKGKGKKYGAYEVLEW